MPIQSQPNRGGVLPWQTPTDQDLIDMLLLARLSKAEGDLPAYQKILNVTMMAMVAVEHEKKNNILLAKYSDN